MTTPGLWKKSSYSGSGDGNACVEVALCQPCIAIRDSKSLARGTLTVRTGVFTAFVDALKGHEGRPV
ncbi:DUF397 domain-containing protein [Streptomyces hirsutus]|uniref:DUF397 domain-containing protein n=1 Tax=Streptomyces TaxID=1883 RepID=UPI00386CEB88|nr:DUF397 domain-containing protein [Streptomyces hirsutus]WTD75159.1 DUF397 domain-containing protein [Streptomyces sp. NBC_01635]